MGGARLPAVGDPGARSAYLLPVIERWIVAALHLAALGVGLGGVWFRARALGGALDEAGIRHVLHADNAMRNLSNIRSDAAWKIYRKAVAALHKAERRDKSP